MPGFLAPRAHESEVPDFKWVSVIQTALAT
jgi:hypothetical protein